MKVLAVQHNDGECRIKVLHYGREQVFSGFTPEIAIKKAREANTYPVSDKELAADMAVVMEEQNTGLRERPVALLT